MQILWQGHACFHITGGGLRVVTDPYTPEVAGLPPLHQAADVVIMSSATDSFHSYAAMVPGDPLVVDALDIARTGGTRTIAGLAIAAIESQESVVHKHNPDDNAMYRFTLEGLRIGHMGDIGNPLTTAQIDFLRNLDVLLALTGGPVTIELDDLDTVLQAVQPRVVIPMHYAIPNLHLNILGLDAFTSRYPREQVILQQHTTFEITRDTLPEQMTIIALQPEANRHARPGDKEMFHS